MNPSRSRLGELLIAQGALDRPALDRLLARQRDEHRRLGELVLSEGLVGEGALRDVLAAQHGVEAVDLEARPPDSAALGLVPPELIRRLEVVPLAIEGQRLFVGMVDPDNLVAREEMRFASGFHDLRVAIVIAADFARFVERELSLRPALDEALSSGRGATIVVEGGGARPVEVGLVETEAPPVVSLLDHVLSVALERDATEVHVEPFDSVSRIRLRVDGHLLTLMTVPRRLHAAVLARLRQVGGAEEGAGALLRVSNAERQGRFRLIPLATARGEKLLLRRIELEPRGLQDLGLSSKIRARLSKCLTPPEGLVLIAGPRESGRSTTAAAIAAVANHPMRQVVLLSRDGMASVPGALSVIVPRPGDLPGVLDDVVAQNPDVIVVDGVEGGESARAVVRAALDGYLVIATTTASRSLEAIERLIGSGVPAWQLAASLQVVIAQRLLRAVHEPCSAAHELSAAEVEEIRFPPDAVDRARFRAARGCGKCHGTGFLGRIVAAEALFATPALRQAISQGAPRERWLELAQADGFQTIWEDAVARLALGKTTLDEVRAVLYGRD